jgi:hypothetical protein
MADEPAKQTQSTQLCYIVGEGPLVEERQTRVF